MPTQVIRLPRRYELISGQVREVQYKTDYAAEVANRLGEAANIYLDRHEIGEGGSGCIFRLPLPEDPDRERRTDWSFVSYERWPADRPYSYRANAQDAVPDLVAEVVGYTDSGDCLIAKVREFLRAGVRLVWVVYPRAQEIHAYWPGANAVRVYGAGDDLDAGDILPGFRTPVAPLFPPVAPDPTP